MFNHTWLSTSFTNGKVLYGNGLQDSSTYKTLFAGTHTFLTSLGRSWSSRPLPHAHSQARQSEWEDLVLWGSKSDPYWGQATRCALSTLQSEGLRFKRETWWRRALDQRRVQSPAHCDGILTLLQASRWKKALINSWELSVQSYWVNLEGLVRRYEGQEGHVWVPAQEMAHQLRLEVCSASRESCECLLKGLASLLFKHLNIIITTKRLQQLHQRLATCQAWLLCLGLWLSLSHCLSHASCR